ncbi:MAG TPA: M48 family metallopeptidase [Chitinophagaceae bacterium]|nr:M48 family metallopeptidase [Chitinophagaceae bacterium]
MPRGKIFTFLLLSAMGLTCLSQDRPVYIFQKDDSLLKRNYYNQVIHKKKSLVSSVEKKQYATDYKKVYETQFKEISELWLSSRIVTASPAHDYLQAVLKQILSVNPELKSMDLRVAFSRDWWPNAFSMGEGSIAINGGLFIFLKDEAELAFVLCHELAHYYLDHTNKSIRKSIETLNSDSLKQEIKSISKQEFRQNEQLEKLVKLFVFDKSRHSRDHESEADHVAYRFMKKTGYDTRAIRSCLELLDKVNDSSLFSPLELQKIFHFPEYGFRKKWIQNESAIFNQMNETYSPLTKEERDSLKTHPDCEKRIRLLEDSISLGKGRFWLVDEKLFMQLKKEFIPEITEQNYRDEQLASNLYYSLQLLQFPEYEPMAVYSVARCLNALYESQKNHEIGLKIGAENKAYSADYNLLLRMLSRVRLDELAALNYQFCKKYVTKMNGYTGFKEEMEKARKINFSHN